MNQFSSISSEQIIDDKFLQLYCYINQTKEIIIARIPKITDWNKERIIFPGERFLFEAPKNAELEIYKNNGKEISKEIIPCMKLKTN